LQQRRDVVPGLTFLMSIGIHVSELPHKSGLNTGTGACTQGPSPTRTEISLQRERLDSQDRPLERVAASERRHSSCTESRAKQATEVAGWRGDWNIWRTPRISGTSMRTSIISVSSAQESRRNRDDALSMRAQWQWRPSEERVVGHSGLESAQIGTLLALTLDSCSRIRLCKKHTVLLLGRSHSQDRRFFIPSLNHILGSCQELQLLLPLLMILNYALGLWILVPGLV
jgi:hypothetical protein